MVRRQAQQKKAAREALEQALAIFEELGARLWAEKARGELRRISGRRAASEELTETELSVADARGSGPIQQGDRRRAVHGREHRRDAPLAASTASSASGALGSRRGWPRMPGQGGVSPASPWRSSGARRSLARSRQFWPTSSAARGARADRRAGDRQDDPVGGRRRAGERRGSSGPFLPWHRGRGSSLPSAGLSELLVRCSQECGPHCRCAAALEVALLLAEPGEETPDAHGSGLPLLDVLSCVAEREPVVVASTTFSGSMCPRRRRCRSRCGVCAWSGSAS